jgi:hypothetical protein
MISASSRRSHVALSCSALEQRGLDLAHSACRVLLRFSRSGGRTAALLGSSAAGAATVAPSPVMKTSVQSRGIGGARR